MPEPEKPLLPAKDDSVLKQFAMFGVVLGQFLGASGVGVGLGWVLWTKAGFPWWTILVTSVLGLFAAGYQVVRYQRILNRRAEGKTP